MRKVVLIIFLLIFSFSLLTQTAQAHVVVTDNNIGAVLHIDPDDDPIAGQQSGFFFEFKDKTNKFDPKNCDCQFAITENGKTIYSQPLFQNADTSNPFDAAVFYTLPKRDVYQILVTGKSNTSGGFQNFMLTYTIRVDRIVDQNAVAKSNTNIILLIFMWSAIFLITVTFSAFMLYKNNSKKKKGSLQKK